MCKTRNPMDKKPRQRQPKSKYTPNVHTVDYETDDSSDNELFVGMVYENVNTISQDWAIDSKVKTEQ